MLCTQGFHQLDVHWLIAVGCEGAKVGLTPAKRAPGSVQCRDRKLVGVKIRRFISDRKLGNNGGLPHKNSVEGAKMSSLMHTVGKMSHILVFHLLVQCLGGLPDATGKAIVNECGLEHFWESGVDIHDTSSCNAAKSIGTTLRLEHKE